MDKVCRGASKLQELSYIIEHLPGEDNLWADMLSIWMPNPSKARTMALREAIAPVLEKDFSWPSISEIQLCQEQSSPGSREMTSSDGFLIFMDKVWIPNAKQFAPWNLYRGTAGHASFEGKKGESQSTSSGNHSKRI